LQDKQQEKAKNASESNFYFKDDHKNTDDESTKAEVSEFIIHPDWDPKDTHYDADIAIAVLKEPIKITNEIRHVCLNTPSHPIQNFAGRAVVYGWGLTEDLELVTELRHVYVPLVDQSSCNNKSNLVLKRIMSDTSFCAGASDGETGPCNGKRFYLTNKSQTKFSTENFSGDSGGGMVLKVGGLSRIIGIISASDGQYAIVDGKVKLICNLDNYVVYTDVSKFHSWINQVVLETN
jgi:secreted trypsin-like serine protease